MVCLVVGISNICLKWTPSKKWSIDSVNVLTVKFEPFVMDLIDSLQPVVMWLRIYKQHHLNTT